jgi:beta-mannanase
MSRQNSRYILLAIVIVGVCVSALIVVRWKDAVSGLLWNVSAYKVELQKDKLYCAIRPHSCVVEKKETSTVNFGIYDFNNTFFTNPHIAIDHYFFEWNDTVFVDNLTEIFEKSGRNNRWVLLTIEPYPNEDDTSLLLSVKKGEYNNQIQRICKSIDHFETHVFVRWGHEMEHTSGRYPWAAFAPGDFIDGYRTFVRECRKVTENAFFVWSPAGDTGLEMFWPGKDYVDYIGLSLFIYSAFEKDYYGHIRSFDEAFSERYKRVKKFNKPIIIAEFGINEPPKIQRFWWYNASKSFADYPLLKTIVYFNAQDTDGVWQGYTTPDWSISSDIFPGR